MHLRRPLNRGRPGPGSAHKAHCGADRFFGMTLAPVRRHSAAHKLLGGCTCFDVAAQFHVRTLRRRVIVGVVGSRTAPCPGGDRHILDAVDGRVGWDLVLALWPLYGRCSVAVSERSAKIGGLRLSPVLEASSRTAINTARADLPDRRVRALEPALLRGRLQSWQSTSQP
jgi:hypothetical protein